MSYSDTTGTPTQYITTIELEFQWRRLQNKGVVVCTAGFGVHLGREDSLWILLSRGRNPLLRPVATINVKIKADE